VRRLYAHYYHGGPLPQDLRWLNDGGPADAIALHDPVGIAVDGDGNTYISDRGDWWGLGVVWKVDTAGTARVIAGTGLRGDAPVAADARQSDLGSPEGVVVDPAGNVLFVDSYNHLLLRIDADGGLTRLAGDGRAGFAGDGGPATQARLNRPYDVRLDRSGNIYIVDHGNQRVRRISPDGVIDSVAGTGTRGYSGDGGPATAAQLNGPYGIFFDRQDRMLIADSDNNVVRRVAPDGTIATLVGTGEPGFAGDGGPAAAALLRTPESLFVAPDGRLFIGDEHNNAVRVVAPDGTITTLIGNGAPGRSRDGAALDQAQLSDPENLFLRDDGALLVTEGDNRRVRLLRPDGTLDTFAGSGR
jgi:DNA-binding beta-propeller fold protein YncE